MSIKKRIGEYLTLCVTYFIVLSVVDKLFLKDENWLYNSIVSSIFFIVGKFMSEIISSIGETKREKIFNIIITIIVMFMIVAFVIGVVLNIPTWGGIVLSITIPFAVSMFIHTKYD